MGASVFETNCERLAACDAGEACAAGALTSFGGLPAAGTPPSPGALPAAGALPSSGVPLAPAPASLRRPSLGERAREALLELAWPTRCVGCDEPGSLLCDECRARLPWIGQRWACPNCGAPFGWVTCTECSAPAGEPWETRAQVSALPLAGIGRALAVAHKDAGERRLAPVVAALVATALDEAAGWPAADGLPRFDAAGLDAVCFVPATAEAFRRRGFDHMEPVSRTLAGMIGLPLADVLARPRALDQRRLGRDERADNARGAVQVVEDVSGLSLLLVDDVVTTGASVRACAAALLGRGARSVTACSLARTW